MSLSQILIDRVRGKHAEFEYPDAIRRQCIDAMRYARDCVKLYEDLPKHIGGRVVLREAEQVIGGIPAWYDPRWGYVAELTRELNRRGDVEIIMPHRKGNPAAIDIGTLQHGFGHACYFNRRKKWLIWFYRRDAYYGHHPDGDKHFPGWKDTRDAIGVSRGYLRPVLEPASIDMTEQNGLWTHIDLVALPTVAANPTEPNA